MTINDAILRRTLKLLQKNKMSQYRLEQESGITHGAMNRIFANQNKTVTFTTVYRLARGFHMTLSEFLDDDLFRSPELEID